MRRRRLGRRREPPTAAAGRDPAAAAQPQPRAAPAPPVGAPPTPRFDASDRYTDLLDSSLRRLHATAEQSHRDNASAAVAAQRAPAGPLPVFKSVEESARAFDELASRGKFYDPGPVPDEVAFAAPPPYRDAPYRY